MKQNNVTVTPCITIMSHCAGNKHRAETRYAGYFDVAAGREAPRWVGWTGLDGRASRPTLLLTGFECQQTKRRIHSGKNVSLIFTRC